MLIYVLVICNHSPTALEGAGHSHGKVLSFYFSIVPQCNGNTRDLYYIGKYGSGMKTYQTAGEKGRRFTNWVSQQ